MATSILDLDLEHPPETVETPGVSPILLIGWKNGVPAGFLEHPPGSALRSGGEIAALLRSALQPEAAPAPLPVPAIPLTVSVVVCTCGRSDELAGCLAALSGQDYPSFEIVVVDNTPADPAVRSLLTDRFPTCRYVPEGRRGVRFARNRGVLEARGEIIAFIDDDCRPVPGWLSAVVGQFAARPALGCCTGPVLPAELETRAQQLMEKRGGFNRGFTRRIFTRESDRDRCRRWPLQAWMFGSGGNMSFRRSVFADIGPFDEVLRTAEDLDIFSRVLRGGFELVYEPAAAVRHRHISVLTALRRRFFLWGWGYIGYLLKVACEDPGYRRAAIGEMAAWFWYQLRRRLWPHLARRDFPLHLVIAEIAGGAAGIPDYLWRRWRSHALTPSASSPRSGADRPRAARLTTGDSHRSTNSGEPIRQTRISPASRVGRGRSG